ncbi:SH3-like domain-containing protein [Rhizobium laguerreae]|uniref:SH3-like domain-containing protein n=2 Tax=Rhizobium/Agrobacterium group TaxID=227290 RepID=UPI001478D39C|nr:SH3-like domain-containing protein [Rhizobium laguerreae]
MGSELLVKKLPNDIGGESAGKVERIEHELLPWEKRCHALADVLDFHKIINTEEKRRGVEALGSEMVGKLSYYERWIAAFANILFQKGILTPGELAVKMEEVEGRWLVSQQSAPSDGDGRGDRHQ